MSEGGDGAKDGSSNRAIDTEESAESASENADEWDDEINYGLVVCGALDAVLLLGQAIPGVSGACKVAREILEKARTYGEKSDEVKAAGLRGVKLVKMVQAFQNQAKKFTDPKDVQTGIDRLHRLLERLRKGVDACDELWGSIGFDQRVANLSKLNKEIGEEMQDIRDNLQIEIFAKTDAMCEIFAKTDAKTDAMYVEMKAEMKALRAELAATSLTEEVPEAADSNTTAGDQTLLHHVFEIVMREYENEEAERKAVDDLDDFLHEHKSTIKKDELLAPECDGRKVKRLCTPLHVACALGKYHFALCLSRKGFDLNKEDVSCRLPFHYAARHGHLKIVEWIIKLHLKRFHPGTTSQTIEDLLKAEDTRGRTALDLAVMAKQQKVVGVLTDCLNENNLSKTINVKSTELPASDLVVKEHNEHPATIDGS